MTTGSPCLRELQDLLLGQILRPFVVAGHLLERHRCFFRAESSAGRKPDRADGAAVDDAFRADVPGGFQQILRAGDVHIVEDRRIVGPERIVRGDMVQLLAAGEGLAQRLLVAQVAIGPSILRLLQDLEKSLSRRASTRTSTPVLTNARTTAAPTNPVAPVTRAFIAKT